MKQYKIWTCSNFSTESLVETLEKCVHSSWSKRSRREFSIRRSQKLKKNSNFFASIGIQSWGYNFPAFQGRGEVTWRDRRGKGTQDDQPLFFIRQRKACHLFEILGNFHRRVSNYLTLILKRCMKYLMQDAQFFFEVVIYSLEFVSSVFWLVPFY